VLVSFLYPLARRVFEFMVLRFRSRHAKDLEIVVSRHELAVLRYQVHQPRLTDADRFLLTATSWVLPRWRWPAFFDLNDDVDRRRVLLHTSSDRLFSTVP
jgi:hypothetical protein